MIIIIIMIIIRVLLYIYYYRCKLADRALRWARLPCGAEGREEAGAANISICIYIYIYTNIY